MTIVLTFSFILMATIACLILIRSNTNPILKAAMVIGTIWYGIALYFLPGYFMGFPKQVDVLPNNAWILTYKINEPSGIDKGGMYFWVIENYQDDINRLNPIQAFKVMNRKTPRAYKLPYNKKMHKQLEDAIKKGKKKGKKNGLLRFTKSGGDEEGEHNKKGKFEIINPALLLPPKD